VFKNLYKGKASVLLWCSSLPTEPKMHTDRRRIDLINVINQMAVQETLKRGTFYDLKKEN